ncbi:MAG TPA: L,D-transpeptidase [Roseiarcus sp.]|nr:L,D-transpeptidase [Roseiarcus sp.]
MTAVLDRRAVVTALGLLLGGCAPPRGYVPQGAAFGGYFPGYGPIKDDGHMIPGLDPTTVNPDKLRREVAFAGPYRPGTIVVDVADRRLYLVEPGGRAIRYTVGVGRNEALNFRGSAVIGRKAEWPRWAPTASMIDRMPRYAAYAGGMPGGLGNPLGARALYLYRGNRDTYFRLHGTNEPETIGTKVSSGCIRLFNHDIIDLYNRVPVGAPVVVLQEPGALVASQEREPTAVASESDVGYGPGADVGSDFDDAAPMPAGAWPEPWRESGPPPAGPWF